MIVVVVPAHDEGHRIAPCLDALDEAARQVPEDVRVVVVLDDCADVTGAICTSRGVRTVATAHRDVGRARATGVVTALADLIDEGHDMRDLWLATTDADSEVAPDWLLQQRSANADVVLGVVELAVPTVAFDEHYRWRGREHPHVHGASMGMTLRAYLRVGGFTAGRVGEDLDLADRLDADPTLVVARSSAVRVQTSARRASRVSGGFADVLLALDRGEAPPVGVRA